MGCVTLLGSFEQKHTCVCVCIDLVTHYIHVFLYLFCYHIWYYCVGVFGEAGSRTSLMNVLMQLRKCCNHPYLFDGEASDHIVVSSMLCSMITNYCMYII